MKKIIYHGSNRIIEKPVYGYGKRFNDYGLGFYCTEQQNMAYEWAVTNESGGYCNAYELDLEGLNVLYLNEDKYTILHWLTVLVKNRTFDIQSDFGYEALEYLNDNFSIDIADYDVIIGYRADDSYFSFAQDFLNNLISFESLSRAMRLGELGEQIVLRSQRAFDRLTFVDAEYADRSIWYPQKEKRDITARMQYKQIRAEGYKRGSLYMMNIIDKEIKADDACLR